LGIVEDVDGLADELGAGAVEAIEHGDRDGAVRGDIHEAAPTLDGERVGVLGKRKGTSGQHHLAFG
jgi:hypothetical protein